MSNHYNLPFHVYHTALMYDFWIPFPCKKTESSTSLYNNSIFKLYEPQYCNN